MDSHWWTGAVNMVMLGTKGCCSQTADGSSGGGGSSATGGTKMYIMNATGNDDVYEYTLSTAWDLSTASYTATFANTDASYSPGEGLPREFCITHAGTNGYVVGSQRDKIARYSLSTAWDVTTMSYEENFSVSGKETNPYGMAVKGDGTSIYIIGYTSDKIHQWDMSTANDLSTASYHGYISTSSQSGAAGGLEFSKDGTKAYMADQHGDDVEAYTLSTAWDITTASHDAALDVSAKEATVNGCAISSDGTKLYIVGSSSDEVHEYTLSTAYDVSSASFSHTLDISDKTTFPMSVSFNMEDV
jgi:sugar lactone lactonase YvrE